MSFEIVGEVYEIYSRFGQDLVGMRNYVDQPGFWEVDKVYYLVEKRLEAGWEMDDPTYIFDTEHEALDCFKRLDNPQVEGDTVLQIT